MTSHKPFGILVELWGRGGILGVQIGYRRLSRMIEELEDQTLYWRRERHGEIRYRNSLKRCSSFRGVTPGLNPLSPYYSGLTQGRGGMALNTVECPVESRGPRPPSKPYAQL